MNELQSSAKTHDLVRLGELVETAIVTISTGVEIGRLNYGTGVIPFIRTSDMSKWELMIDPKHGVSGEIYKHYSDRNKVMEHDILMVRDGTYLVGTSCMLTKYHTKILFQSHIFRIRVTDPTELSPFLLLALINSPLVKRQIRAKQFTQDIIDTLGNRIMDLILPIPKDEETRRRLTEDTRIVIEERAELRQNAKVIVLQITGAESPDPFETDLLAPL